MKNVIDIIYPPVCLSCKNPVAEAISLCSDCWEDINFISNPKCQKCGMPFEIEAHDEALCGECIAKPPPYNQARAAFVYEDKSAPLITGFKYGDKLHSTKYFAGIMARSGKELIERTDIIVPVPLHRIRLFKRRYNQASLLANVIAKQNLLPVINNLLIRKKNTPPQASLLFRQRIKNVQGAFTFNAKYNEIIKGKNILLIDDVMTTGATIKSCCRRLLKAGASEVNVLTIARTTKG